MKVLVSKFEDNKEVTRGGGGSRNGNIVEKLIDITKEQLRDNLKNLVEEVSYAIDSIEDRSEKYKLNSVEINLAINGEGTLYIVKAGAEASIMMTLQRNAE